MGKNKGSVARKNLLPQQKIWTTFIKRCLLPSSHNETVNRPHLALLDSILKGRKINIGSIILAEIYATGSKKGTLLLSFLSLITGICINSRVATLQDDIFSKKTEGWGLEKILLL